MPQNFSPQIQVRSLSPGNIVSIAIAIYRSHFKTYLQQSLISFAWILVPIYGWAKYFAISGLISRLAFQEFINQPEEINTAHNYTNSRLWSFLGVAFRVGVLLILIYLGLSIGLFLVLAMAGSLIRVIFGLMSSNPVIAAVLGIILGAGLIIGFIYTLIWFFSRWMIAEVPLAVEENINSKRSVGKSWDLTKNFVKQIQTIVMIAFAITLPILIVTTYIPQFFLIPLERNSIFYAIGYAIALLMTFIGSCLVMPLWQAIKAILYFELRNRREGLGLQLRNYQPDQEQNSIKVVNIKKFLNCLAIQTPESVELELTLAGIGNRTYATIIDYVALGLTLFVFWVIWAIFTTQLIDTLQQITGRNSSSLGLWLFAIALLINFAIYIGYFIFFEVFWQGQTPGKRYAKIRVIQDDGRRVSIQQATLRALLRPIDDSLFIGAILVLFNRQEKRLGDLVAGTIVIQEEYTTAVKPPTISEAAEQLATELPQMADLSKLLPDDFTAIREYLQTRSEMMPKAKADLSLQMARQIRSIISLEKLPSGLTPDVFLEAVYLAYQQL